MEESGALRVIRSSVQAIGKGFDANCDTRLLYCKGAAGSRVVKIDEEQRRELVVLDGLVVPDVPGDVQCSPEVSSRKRYGACSFYEMAEYFNQEAHLSGNIPLGSFNSAFNFTGSKKNDASAIKSLAVDGKFIPLCKVHILKQFSSLEDEVRLAVPRSWEPLGLAR